MLWYILLGIAGLIALFLVIVARQPADFRVERKAIINAPPAVVFEQVNDFHNWEAWSPWAKLDPKMKETYEGPATGVGAVYGWNGNGNVGEGRMTIIESRPHDLIRITLEFKRPFAGVNDVEFHFKPEGPQTVVSWIMVGKLAFIPKAIHLFVSMDKMCGGFFDKGLADMKTRAEATVKV